MKRLALAIGMALGIASAAVAAQKAKVDPGPAVINLKMGVMLLPFSHAKHQKQLNNECWHCHTKNIGKIEGWSKETAHTICIACHDLDNKGPVACHECHKKEILK